MLDCIFVIIISFQTLVNERALNVAGNIPEDMAFNSAASVLQWS
jgi:hypothetical protein